MLIPAGEHRIEFDFRSQDYVTAAYVSSFGSFLLLLLVIGGIGYWGRRETLSHTTSLRTAKQ
jgi:hypothetical protein